MCKNMHDEMDGWVDGLLSTSWTPTSILFANALAFSLDLCPPLWYMCARVAIIAILFLECVSAGKMNHSELQKKRKVKCLKHVDWFDLICDINDNSIIFSK